MECRNFQYNRFGGVDCEVNHPKYGWVPYTMSEEESKSVINSSGSIQDYIEPEAPSREDLLNIFRESAYLTRAQFCVAIKRAGILPADEAIEAAKGNWPQTFSDALEGLPVDEDEAQIVWASVTTIPRNDVVLEAIRVAAGMTEEEVDTMFGWEE